MIDISAAMYVFEGSIDSRALAMLVHTEIHFESSNGSEWDQEFSVISKDVGVTAKGGNETQSRSYGFNGLQKGLEDLDDEVLRADAMRIGNQAIELLGARNCPSDIRDLILTPDQL